jgi:hypothetical protein
LLIDAPSAQTAAVRWLDSLLRGDLGAAWNAADPGFRERVARYGLASWHGEIEAGGGTVLSLELATASSREGDALWEIPGAFLAELRAVVPTDDFSWEGAHPVSQEGYEIASYADGQQGGQPLRFLMKAGDDGWRLAGIAASGPLPGWPPQVALPRSTARRRIKRRRRARGRRR